MDWDDVRVLLAVLEAGNLHDAGTRLGVDRSTVSRRLSALERRLKARLFTRTREGLRPTASAERVRPYAEQMATDAAAVARAALGQAEAVRGRVRVATTEAIGTLLVEQGLLAVQARHPDLGIELQSSNAPVDLLRGEADLALRISPLRHASLRARRIARMPIALYAAPAYLARRGRPSTPVQLRGHDLVLPGGDLARLPEARWLVARPGVRVAFRSNSVPALLAAAADGAGLVPLSVPLGDRDRRLERLQLLDAVPERVVWLVVPAAVADRAALRVVADEIAAVFARLGVGLSDSRR